MKLCVVVWAGVVGVALGATSWTSFSSNSSSSSIIGSSSKIMAKFEAVKVPLLDLAEIATQKNSTSLAVDEKSVPSKRESVYPCNHWCNYPSSYYCCFPYQPPQPPPGTCPPVPTCPPTPKPETCPPITPCPPITCPPIIPCPPIEPCPPVTPRPPCPPIEPCPPVTPRPPCPSIPPCPPCPIITCPPIPPCPPPKPCPPRPPCPPITPCPTPRPCPPQPPCPPVTCPTPPILPPRPCTFPCLPSPCTTPNMMCPPLLPRPKRSLRQRRCEVPGHCPEGYSCCGGCAGGKVCVRDAQNSKVKLSVMFSALGNTVHLSHLLISQQVLPAVRALPQSLKVELVPSTPSFHDRGCEEDDPECLANLIVSCAGRHLYDLEATLEFSLCFMSQMLVQHTANTTYIGQAARECMSSKPDEMWEEVYKCGSSDEGKRLFLGAQHRYQQIADSSTHLPSVAMDDVVVVGQPTDILLMKQNLCQHLVGSSEAQSFCATK